MWGSNAPWFEHSSPRHGRKTRYCFLKHHRCRTQTRPRGKTWGSPASNENGKHCSTIVFSMRDSRNPLFADMRVRANELHTRHTCSVCPDICLPLRRLVTQRPPKTCLKMHRVWSSGVWILSTKIVHEVCRLASCTSILRLTYDTHSPA